MSLQRSNTRFGPGSIRGPTPDSGEESSGTRSSHDSASTKLRKRSRASRGSDTPLQSPRQIPGGEAPRKIPPQLSGQNIEKAIPSAPLSYKRSKASDTKINYKAPWESLQKRFKLDLEEVVLIASQEDGRLVAVREFSDADADKRIDTLDRIRRESHHESSKYLLSLLECFSYDGIRYAVFEHDINHCEKLSITLNHYALIADYPSESHLATILGQVCLLEPSDMC
jgi:hypothetical protein